MRLSAKQFEAAVERVMRRIPAEIQQYLRDVTVTIRSHPSKKLLREMEVPPDETLMGFYDGTPISERSVTDPIRYPDTVVLFQRPIEEECDTMEELEDEIEVTIVHEVAHYVGIDEDRLAELGYD